MAKKDNLWSMPAGVEDVERVKVWKRRSGDFCSSLEASEASRGEWSRPVTGPGDPTQAGIPILVNRVLGVIIDGEGQHSIVTW